MNRILKLVFCTIAISSFAQKDDIAEEEKKALYLKGNLATLMLGMPNVGVEYQLSNKYTLQADVFISPWKSFLGNHAQLYMGHIEGRYYFKEAFDGWYVGANIGGSVYDLAKWNYWNTGKYQRGFNYMLGAVVGYQFQWKDKWNIDVFLGGGNSQGFYHGYEKNEYGEIVRYEEAPWFNKSGEWIPYRGGVMISYKFK